MPDHREEKLLRLGDILSDLQSVLVAFSGGVDSSYLLAAALDTLGSGAVLAVTADSATRPGSEHEEAVALARALGVRHRTINTAEMADPRFLANTPDRCYHCKLAMLRQLHDVACTEGLQHVALGATLDDLGDYRPGMLAAREMGVHSPLLEAGLTKAEIRLLSRERGLPTWDKPSMACLVSRIPYGTEITLNAVQRIAAAESLLRDLLGPHQLRVRDHGPIARIEVEAERFGTLIEGVTRERIAEEFLALGYQYVTLDLIGFRSGSMDEVLNDE